MTSRTWILWLLGLLLIATSALLSLTVGSRDIPIPEGLHRLPTALRYAFDSGFHERFHADEFTVIIANLRVPRTLLALMAGSALGIAGSIIQGHTRNALADPGLLGVNAGAAVAIVGSIYVGLSTAGDAALLPAMIGAGIAAAAVFALSSTGTTAASPLTLVLAGTAITALLMALVNAMVITDTSALDTLRAWATGSVAGRPLTIATTLAPLFVLGLLLAATQGRALNLLSMGSDVAVSLGHNIALSRVIGLLAVTILGGVAVNAAGPVAFIGLAAPHAARSIFGADYRAIIPTAGLIGSMFALWADIVGRLLSTSELPMGIVLGIAGVPIFIYLVKRGKVVTP